MIDMYEYSATELIRLLGTRFREYRLRCNMTQKEVAERTGLGITTITTFENGATGNVSLATFILLLKAVGQVNSIDCLLPELPESPYLHRSGNRKVQRIRHKDNE